MRSAMRAAPVLVLLAALVQARPADADDLRQRVPARPGGRLVVDLSVGAIEVETHDEELVEVDARGDRMEFELDYDDDEVTLRGRHEGWFGWRGGRVRVHVRVPSRFDIDLRTSGGPIDVENVEGRVEARTSGGNLELQGIRGSVDVETSGGTIRGQEIEGPVRGRTSGGSIHLSQISGPVEVETSGGDVRIREAGQRVEAQTSGGGISVRFSGPAGGHLETSGGSIEVELASGVGVDLEAHSSGGRVEIDEALGFDGRSSHSEARGSLAGGGESLRLETSGGNIVLQLR